MELIILVIVTVGVIYLVSKDKKSSDSVEKKDSPHRGGDDNITNKQQ